MNATHARPMLAFGVLALLAAVFTTLGLQQPGGPATVAGSPRSATKPSGQAAGDLLRGLPEGSTSQQATTPGVDPWTPLIAARLAPGTVLVPAVATTATPTSSATATTADVTTSRTPGPAAVPSSPKPRRHHAVATTTKITAKPTPRPTLTPTSTVTPATTGPGHGHGKGRGHVLVQVSAPTGHGKGRGH